MMQSMQMSCPVSLADLMGVELADDVTSALVRKGHFDSKAMRTQRFNEWARLPDPAASLRIERAPYNGSYDALFALYCKNRATRYNDGWGHEFDTAISQARSISADIVPSTAKHHIKAAKNRLVHKNDHLWVYTTASKDKVILYQDEGVDTTFYYFDVFFADEHDAYITFLEQWEYRLFVFVYPRTRKQSVYHTWFRKKVDRK